MAWLKGFPQVNFTWKGFETPEGLPDVEDMPCFRQFDEEGRMETISMWKVTWIERLAVLWTGQVWLRAWGQQIPVCIEALDPWGAGVPGVMRRNLFQLLKWGIVGAIVGGASVAAAWKLLF